MMIDLRVKNATIDDIPAIINIGNSQLGKDYLNESIANSINNVSEVLFVVKGTGEDVLGFCYAYFKTSSQIQKDLGINLPTDQFISGSLLAELKTIVVQEEYHKKGIARVLVQHLLSYLQEISIYNIICLGWKSKEGINIERLMKFFQFEYIQEIKEYWKCDSLKRKYKCPVCGNPCLCSAILYSKSISRDHQ